MRAVSGSVWIHTRTQNHYVVVGIGKVKIAGEWKAAITYRRLAQDEFFTRTDEDFYASFTMLQPNLGGV